MVEFVVLHPLFILHFRLRLSVCRRCPPTFFHKTGVVASVPSVASSFAYRLMIIMMMMMLRTSAPPPPSKGDEMMFHCHVIHARFLLSFLWQMMESFLIHFFQQQEFFINRSSSWCGCSPIRNWLIIGKQAWNLNLFISFRGGKETKWRKRGKNRITNIILKSERGGKCLLQCVLEFIANFHSSLLYQFTLSVVVVMNRVGAEREREIQRVKDG